MKHTPGIIGVSTGAMVLLVSVLPYPLSRAMAIAVYVTLAVYLVERVKGK